MEPSYIKPTMLSLVKELKKRDDHVYKRYGDRDDKEEYTFDQFCSKVDHYYSFASSKKNSSHFFRKESCQTSFRKMENLEKNDAADHIISTAVFREIILSIPDQPKYTYDYWVSVRSTINQCWNFQKLTKSDNLEKAKIETKICYLLKEKKIDDLKKNTSCMNYLKVALETFNAALKKKKKFFQQSTKIQKGISSFFAELGYTLDFSSNNNSHVSCVKEAGKKKCQLCSHSAKSSKTWRFKYSILYQNKNSEANIKKIFHSISLSLLYQDIFSSDAEKEEKLAGITATTIWGVYTEIKNQEQRYRLIINKFWELARLYCLKKSQKMKKENLITHFEEIGVSQFPKDIGALLDDFLNGGTKIDLTKNLSSIKMKQEVYIKWGNNNGNGPIFKQWLISEKTTDITYLVHFVNKTMKISRFDNITAETAEQITNLTEEDCVKHLADYQGN